ncbi:MAG TPA: acetyl/propionyl-CoA carboxylase subunit alpha, partial [Phenylobacterium sp.]|nr:acetyl/propionyl-CoA carboxylase subunit alpha [Phenylobacterium sp.]
DFQRDLMAAVGCAMHRTLTRRASPQLDRDDWVVVAGSETRNVRLSNGGASFKVEMPETGRVLSLTDIDWRPGQPLFRGKLDGVAFTVAVKAAAEGFVIRHRACTLKVLVLSPRSAELHHKLPPKKAADTSKMILSPMPGLVVTLDVEVGQQVRSGEQVAIIEAMKMQNIIRAERDGVVKSVGAKSGDSVAADEVLIEFA